MRAQFELRAEGLRKSFGGVEVLHGVDLAVRGGRVLALLGENGAGKSTAIKIIAGDYQRDAGSILINGDSVDITQPAEAEAQGIRVIFQEFMDAPALSVAENISLGQIPERFPGVVDWAATRRRARRVLGQLGVHLDVRQPVAELAVAERQVVEIARALAADARVLILDEPTSALAAEEVANLFRFVRRLRDEGVAIVYITHRLDEVDEIADDVIVFRDGRAVASGPIGEFGRERIIEAMVGQALEAYARRPDQVGGNGGQEPDGPGREVLRVERAASIPGFSDISFSVRSGEIVSLFGRLGCGALEVAEAVFGLRPLDRGEILLADRAGQPRSPTQAKRRGVGFVPVDRKQQGILANRSVAENLTVASWPRLARFRSLLPPRVLDGVYDGWRERLKIHAVSGPRQETWTLSGGNQQKVVVGRWLAERTTLLVLAEPTRGVDVGARADLYRLLEGLAADGVALVVVSSDVEEVLRISDRILVMSRGQMVDEFRGREATRAVLTSVAAKDVA